MASIYGIDLPDLDDHQRATAVVLIAETVNLDTGEHQLQTIASDGITPWTVVGMAEIARRDALDACTDDQDDE